MNPDILPYLICPDCEEHDLSLDVYSSLMDGQIIEGRLNCMRCSNWFRIENGIVDLLPARIRRNNYERFWLPKERFAVRHGLILSRVKEDITPAATDISASGKLKPVGAFEDVVDYERRVVNNPYYKALDWIAFHAWMLRTLDSDDFVLDIGCGPGRQCVPLGERQIRTVAMDIDEEMLKSAAGKITEKSLCKFVDLVVADGENPPVRKDTFTACILYGVLHHLSEKESAIKNAAAKLIPGGFIYSLDPHKSLLRFLFDLLMRIRQLWVEEASEDPLMTENQITEWMKNAGIEGRVRLSTYLPPHMFIAGFSSNVFLLKTTDWLLGHIPWIRKTGGVMIYEGKKTIKGGPNGSIIDQD